MAYKTNRTDVADPCRDPEVRKSIEANLAPLDPDDRLLADLALHLTRTAKVHDVNAFYRLRSVPGIGKILALVLLYKIHDIHRFPRVQDFVSSCWLVKCAANKFFHLPAQRAHPLGAEVAAAAALGWEATPSRRAARTPRHAGCTATTSGVVMSSPLED